MKLMKFLLFLAFLFVCANALADCGKLTSANTTYVLTQNVSSSGTCFIISANNVTLDCDGFSIAYSNSTIGIGINISRVNYTVIKNCNIVQNTTSSASYGIYLTNSFYSELLKNRIVTRGDNAHGIYLISAALNTVFNNSINTRGNSGAYGLFLSSSANNNISKNTILTQSNGGYGIYLRTAVNNVISGNIINATIGVAPAVLLHLGSSNNSFSNNTIKSVYFGIMSGFTSGNFSNNFLNKFSDDVIIPCGYSDIFINQSGNATFQNVSFNRTNVTIGTWGSNNLTVTRFVRVNVTDSVSSAAVPNAAVSVNDSAGASVLNELTDSLGLTNWGLFTDYFVTAGGGEAGAPSINYSYFNNLSFAVNASGYNSSAASLNITSTSTVLMLLEGIVLPTPVLPAGTPPGFSLLLFALFFLVFALFLILSVKGLKIFGVFAGLVAILLGILLLGGLSYQVGTAEVSTQYCVTAFNCITATNSTALYITIPAVPPNDPLFFVALLFICVGIYVLYANLLTVREGLSAR